LYYFIDDNLQNQLRQKEQFFCVSMEKSIVPDPAKPFGQHMLHEKAQEVLAFERAPAGLTAAAFDVLESHLDVFVGEDVFFAEDSAIDVPGQVSQEL
jgi:hypothetical protein